MLTLKNLYIFIIIQILQFQERTQTNPESNYTLSIPSLDSESEIIPISSSQGDVLTRKKRGLGHLDKSSIISSDTRSKRTRNEKKYPK